MSLPPTFVNSGRVMYDVAITGINPNTGNEEPIPFLVANSEDYPYLRESDGGVREQIDTTGEPGEQSLSGYWWRSQASFDLGMGAMYFDPARDDSLARRFHDSCGVDVFTPGKSTLINESSKVVSFGHKTYACGYTLVDENGQVTEEGVLIAKSVFSGTPSATVVKVTSEGVTTTLVSDIDAVYDIASDGGWCWILKDDGVHKVHIASGLQGPMLDLVESGVGNVKRGRIAAVKDRLVLALSQEEVWDTSFGYVYFLAPTDGSLPKFPIGTVRVPGWRWTGICDGPSAIYLGGYSGDTGRIYAVKLDQSEVSPVVGAPFTVAELPKGEIVTSVVSYMQTYLVVGTNRGLRVATINPDSSLTMGPLSVKSETPVWGMCCSGDYVYAGGSICLPHGDVPRPGLFKLNLGVDGTDPRSQLGIFPVARDLYAPDTTNPGVNQVVRVCPIGSTGRIAFTVDNTGLYFEGVTEVPSGWLRTGRIRFDTQEKKSFDFLRVNRDNSGISVTPFEEHDGVWGGPAQLTETVGVPGLSTEYEAVVSRTSRYQEVRYTFVITRAVSNGSAFTGYQLRGLPSNVVGRSIRIPLLCFPREKSREGLDIDRPTWDRIKALELIEKRGGYVRLQNLNTGENELATFESIQFITTHTQQSRQDQANPGGMLVVTLRLVNLGS